jgi:hypothetical protein
LHLFWSSPRQQAAGIQLPPQHHAGKSQTCGVLC